MASRRPMVLLAVYFVRPGRFLGLDGIIQSLGFVKRRPRLNKVITQLG